MLVDGFNHLEKYESQWNGPYIMENNTYFQTTNQCPLKSPRLGRMSG
jgi:hypothetical protein